MNRTEHRMEPMVFQPKTNQIELLSPVRSWESLRAAVQNGADAVYLGLRSFHARAGAGGFSFEEFRQVLDYAHQRDTAVHLTLNVLIKETELEEALELAYRADEMGTDAIIVQDLGLASRLAGTVRAKLHASTQMTVYNTEGLSILRRMGFTRCIPARELSLEEISKLCQAGLLEIEVFAHGALCMSYSGQCLMSSRLGGRSGNRGTCAQPCRLSYAIQKKDPYFQGNFSYCLSPADLCSLSYLDRLTATGIRSLKIEGRLKSPEYVALTTRAYRLALDRIAGGETPVANQQEIRELAQMFSRGGFTAGHQLGRMPLSAITGTAPGRTGLPCGTLRKPVRTRRLPNAPVTLFDAQIEASLPLHKGDGIAFEEENGPLPGGVINVISIQGKPCDTIRPGQTGILTIAGTAPSTWGQTVYKTYDADLAAACHESYRTGSENKKAAISGHLVIRLGEPALFTVWDSRGNRVSTQAAQTAEAALNRETGAERIRQQLEKLGDTPFQWQELQMEVEHGVFYPIAAINHLRRTALEMLLEKRKGRLYP